MVNHFRTLFLNEAASPDERFEQYIDPSFSSVGLNGDQAAVRSLLIQDSLPRDYKNFIATLMTRMAYSSEASTLIDEIDQRTTIDLRANTQESLRDTISLSRDNQAESLQIVGRFLSNPAVGIFSNTWLLQESGSDVLVTIGRSGKQMLVTPIFSGSGTGLHQIDPDSPLYLQFVGVSSVPAGMVANVSAVNSMTYDMTTALANLRSEDRVYNLFRGIKNGSELQDIFENSVYGDQVISAVLIAYCLSVSKNQ